MRVGVRLIAWGGPLLLLLLSDLPAHGGAGVIEYGDPPRSPQPGAALPQARGAALAGPGGAGLSINLSRREESRIAYNTLHAASEAAVAGWDGALSLCLAGTTAPAFKELTLLRINYFRAMAGVPAAVVLDSAFSAKDQAAALMMAANNRLSHTPPSTWLCYTAEGAEAAGKSNLALGPAGPTAISGYVEDYGTWNYPVGHRRWLLYPQTRVMGTGDIPRSGNASGANATWILDAHYFDPRPATRDDFVAWPPPGYVPYPLVFPRWSFGYPNADFSAARVTMTAGGAPLAVTLEANEANIGENTLVWYPSQLDPTQPLVWPRPTADTSYTVSVANVQVDGKPRSFTYTVTVFDPQVPGADAVLTTLSGPDPAALNQANLYAISPLPRATGYEWLRGRPAGLSVVEDAETGLGAFTPSTSSDYELLVTLPGASGKCYRLAHPEPEDQQLTCQRLLLPGASARVSFRSRLTLATSSQQAKVQVSLDQGLNWQDIYSQAGTNDVDGYGELEFVDRQASLAPFAGRPLLLRFNYHLDTTGSYYQNTDLGLGWHLDDVAFSNTEEIREPATTSASAHPSFTFTPNQLGEHALCARAQYYGQYGAEWGLVRRVNTQVLATPRLEIVGAPRLQGGQMSLEFLVTNYRPTLAFDLMRASSLAGPWQAESQATLEVVSANTRFRLSAPLTAGSPRFFRVRAN